MVGLTVFAAVSGFLLYVSRKSLFLPRSHGFWRFFAWESILALLLLNLPAGSTTRSAPCRSSRGSSSWRRSSWWWTGFVS